MNGLVGMRRLPRAFALIAGERIDGQDPAAPLLTQLSRCLLILRADEPGKYRVDREALDRRDVWHAEADAKVVRTNDRDYDVFDLAQALAAVEAQVKRIDREITEVTKIVDRLAAWWFFTNPDAPAPATDHPTAVAA